MLGIWCLSVLNKNNNENGKEWEKRRRDLIYDEFFVLSVSGAKFSFRGPNWIWYQERKKERERGLSRVLLFFTFVDFLLPLISLSNFVSTSSLQFELEVNRKRKRGTTDLFEVVVNLLDLRFKVADEEEGDEGEDEEEEEDTEMKKDGENWEEWTTFRWSLLWVFTTWGLSIPQKF